MLYVIYKRKREEERGREGEKEGGREGRQRGREGGKKGGKKGGRGRERREERREGGREGGINYVPDDPRIDEETIWHVADGVVGDVALGAYPQPVPPARHEAVAGTVGVTLSQH